MEQVRGIPSGSACRPRALPGLAFPVNDGRSRSRGVAFVPRGADTRRYRCAVDWVPSNVGCQTSNRSGRSVEWGWQIGPWWPTGPIKKVEPADPAGPQVPPKVRAESDGRVGSPKPGRMTAPLFGRRQCLQPLLRFQVTSDSPFAMVAENGSDGFVVRRRKGQDEPTASGAALFV